MKEVKSALKHILCLAIPLLSTPVLSQNTSQSAGALTPFERDTLASATYAEAIDYYRVLAEAYPALTSLDSIGETDIGEPLLAFSIGTGGAPYFLINNGIHAGEPCGVDASMMLARKLLATDYLSPALDSGTVVIVPALNVGGMLNRGGGTRANQNGPRAYGFRGNARNLDLNRDFMKQDSRNVQALTRLIARLSPDVFVDTHTTNGADYQYAMTVIETQADKLGPVLGPYLHDVMTPALFTAVEDAGYPICPYVYSAGVPQEGGIYAFIETPRYSTGYAALFGTLSFVTEAHMLKPFAVRVRATEAFLEAALGFWSARRSEIAALRRGNATALRAADSTVLTWAVDTTRADTLAFRGYAPIREPSAVTGAERLRYDGQQPQTVATPVYAYAKPLVSVRTPRYYFVPAAYRELVEDLAAHGVSSRYVRDTSLTAVAYTLREYQTRATAYEGHYLHYGIEVDTAHERPGDVSGYLVPVDQTAQRLIVAALEPTAPDGYFAWGVFDGHLQRKEHYSAYVFEETAAALLAADGELKKSFEGRKATDVRFREDPGAQLDWLYERSGLAELNYGRYPILRIE